MGRGILIGADKRVRPVVDSLLTVVGVWSVMTAPFALATALADGGQFAAAAPHAAEGAHFFQAGELYLWQLVAALPFMEATTTLDWGKPVMHYSPLTGVLLLLYKGLVLAPGLVVVRAAWNARHGGAARAG